MSEWSTGEEPGEQNYGIKVLALICYEVLRTPYLFIFQTVKFFIDGLIV